MAQSIELNLFGGRKWKSRWPCGVCENGVGRNSIFCNFCNHWVHKSCSGIPGPLIEDASFKRHKCAGNIPPSARGETESLLGNEKLEVVDDFCYLGDVTDQTGVLMQ